MEITQEEIIIRCQGGELENFGHLYDMYVRKIYNFIFYRTFHKETAEDLTSLTFTKALERIGSFNPAKGTFSAWLYQIARNTLIDNYYNSRATDSEEAMENMPAGVNLEHQTDAKLNLEKVKSFLKNLEADKREIVVLRVWDGLSYKEIAQIVGRSEASCKMVYSRVVEKLNQEVALAVVYLLIMKAGL